MTTAVQAAPKTGMEKWQDGLSAAAGNAKWDAWDCEIQLAVNEYNRHLSSTTGYVPLDWLLIKAMVWVETGADNPEWKTKPMQIGVPGDPGLASFLSGKEGGDLILPSSLKGRLTLASARTVPTYNIRAGIGYLLMQMAISEHGSVLGADKKVYEVNAKAGDSLEHIAKTNGTTVDVLKRLNPASIALRPGHVLKYQKASVRRVIVRWRHISTASIAARYNGGGDPNYAKKLDFALALVRKQRATQCAQ